MHQLGAKYVRAIVGHSPSKEVQVDYATKYVILEMLSTSTINLDVHAVRVEQEYAMGASFTTVIKIHRVIAVEIGPIRCPIGVSIPYLEDIS
jgi:hypothetical protein